MTLLLLSDFPPSTNFTGGQSLAEQCRALAPGSLAAFIALNPNLKPLPAADLGWIPTETVAKPPETWRKDAGPHAGISMPPAVEETFTRLVRVRRLLRRAEIFARRHKVDRIWAVLEGQVMTYMALPLARRLGVPLYVQVWDPLEWWLDANKVDPFNRKAALRLFDKTISASAACATASWNMAAAFADRYSVPAVPVILGADAAKAMPVSTGPAADAELRVGMAGQFYAADEWTALLQTFRQRRWTIAGRRVTLVVFSGDPVPAIAPEDRVEQRGWVDRDQLPAALAANADILYCPYPMAPALRLVSDLSFPSKIPIYMAAGLPILFHGSLTSSPGRYLAEKGAAVLCPSLEPEDIAGCIEMLAADPECWTNTAAGGRRAFLEDLTVRGTRESFLKFLASGR